MSDRDCEHGQLARSCNICDLERELKAVTQQRDKLLESLGLAADMLDMIGQHPQTVANIRRIIAATYPETNNGHDRTTEGIRVYPSHFERYIAQP